MTAGIDASRNGAPPAPAPVDDFDAFWATYTEARRPKVRIRGVEVTTPYDVPLAIAERIEAASPGDDQAVMDLLTELYGDGIVDRWKAAGMGSIELFVVLTWSYMRAGGAEASFEDAMNTVQRAFDSGELDAEQTVPNRADKRAAGKGKGRGGRNARSGAR